MKKYLFIICLLFPLLSFGQFWDSLGLGLSGDVRSLYNDEQANELYVGGQFMMAGTDTVSCITMWDGIKWNKLDKGIFRGHPNSACSSVYGITKYQGNIYASGEFFETETALARWNGTTWDSITTFSSAAQFMEYQNELYAFGLFKSVDTIDAWGIAKWDGQIWSAIDTTKWEGHGIYTAAFYNGELYIGGNFWNEDESIVDLAKWNGTTWEALDSYVYQGASSTVTKLLVYKNRLYVMGSFEYPDFPGNSIIAWDGSNWDNLGNGLYPPQYGVVHDAHIFNNKLHITGGFLGVSNVPAHCIAIWDDTTWCGLGSDFYLNCPTTLEDYNGDLIIGLGNGTIDSIDYNHIARWTGGDYVDTCATIYSSTDDIDTYNDLSIAIFPNPTTNSLTIKFDYFTPKDTEIEIFDMVGQRVHTQLMRQQNEQISLSHFANGIYVVQVRSGAQTWTRKVVKQ